MLLRLLLTALALGACSGQAQAQRRTSAIETVCASACAARSETPTAIRQPFRIADDAWIGQDKILDHFAVALVLAAVADRVTHAETGAAERRVFLWSGAFWFGNEVKDAVLPYEKVGWVGGDGFSYKDLLWSLAGAGLALTVF